MANQRDIYDLPMICGVCLLEGHVQSFDLRLQEIFRTVINISDPGPEIKRYQNICKNCSVTLERLDVLIHKCKKNEQTLETEYLDRKIKYVTAENKFNQIHIKHEEAESLQVKIKLEPSLTQQDPECAEARKERTAYFPIVCGVCLLHGNVQPFDLKLPGLLKTIVNESRDEVQQRLPKNVCESCILELQDLEDFIEGCRDNKQTLQAEPLETTNKNSNWAKDSSGVDTEKRFNKMKVKDDEVDCEKEEKTFAVSESDSPIRELSQVCALTNNMSPDKLKKSYKCPCCENTFNEASCFKVHLRDHKGEKPFVCNYCGKKILYKNSLKVHMLKHKGETQYICPHCNKGFYDNTTLKRHVNQNHNNLKLPCPHCEKEFYEKRVLEKHISTHQKRSPHKCSQCDLTFKTAHKLKVHLAEHQNDNQFVCIHCGKGFMYRSHWDIHVRRHTGEKPCVCPYCNKQFAEKCSLKQHMLSHTREKQYKCNMCEKAFIRPHSLKCHLLKHKGEKPFACTYCEKAFVDNTSLKRHLKNHVGIKQHECSYCKKTFLNKSTLNRHIMVHTGDEPHKCTLCGKTFNLPNHLEDHMLTHNSEKPLTCTYCDEQFNDENMLKKHIVQCEEKSDGNFIFVAVKQDDV